MATPVCSGNYGGCDTGARKKPAVAAVPAAVAAAQSDAALTFAAGADATRAALNRSNMRRVGSRAGNQQQQQRQQQKQQRQPQS